MQFLRLWWAALALLLWAPHVCCRPVSLEDIRDSTLSLVRSIKKLEDEQSRHDYREKTTGEYVKRMLEQIHKNQKSFDSLKEILSKFDQRLTNIETITLQKEQRENETQNEMSTGLEAIRESVEVLTNTINQNEKPPATEPTHKLEMGFPVTDAKIDALSTDINNFKKNLSKDNLRNICSESSDASLNEFTLESEKLLNKFELTLNEFVNSSKASVDLSVSEVSPADETLDSKMTEVTYNHTKKLQELLNNLTFTNENLENSLTKRNTMMEQTFNNMSRLYNTFQSNLLLMELVMQQNQALVVTTSKNVVEIKSSMEHRLHGVQSELKESILLQNKNLNNTLSERLENIQTALITTYGYISDSLSRKLELEISQVRRQIGVMFQKVAFNKIIHDEIQEQTRNHVNVTGSFMEEMKNKVGLMTTHMSDVESNFNFLLEKLSISSQEFNQIKNKLSKALNDIRDSITKGNKHLDDTLELSWIASSKLPSST